MTGNSIRPAHNIQLKKVIILTWLLRLEVKFSEPKSENVHVTSTEIRY